MASKPLTCDIEYFGYFEFLLLGNARKSMNRLRESLPEYYSKFDIFTLSNIVQNDTLKYIASFLSAFKLSSYDCEQLFSEMKQIKVAGRYNLSDPTLRNILVVKYNSQRIDLDPSQFEFEKTDDMYNKIYTEFSSITDGEDKLLEDDTCMETILKDNGEEEKPPLEQFDEPK